ncbi:MULTISPECIES: hypothetical protein [Planococcus]|uniref:Bacterial Pleckstrin homology domain-containing protein n=1 Tax=Planococcus faecalis TaxID=1598147 RepID=A0ABM6IPD4_9BACL|nr:MULTISPECIES: hypothetical protein [Planococcus]AQU78062.1 hypothetical protein AJGP001_01500 [Planococcus faecalis]MDJ0331316.1 hypothetical protein [Planococcus sp. S3-L1]OHX53678.1 hypothetical protein BB777_07930 [Planococcus faecalis]
MDQVNLLSSITYIDTERSIESGEIKITDTECNIHLYEDIVVTSATKFQVANVWDVSYKSFSSEASLLYLHTHRGVLTYKVYTDPDHFVETFKKLKNKHY